MQDYDNYKPIKNVDSQNVSLTIDRVQTKKIINRLDLGFFVRYRSRVLHVFNNLLSSKHHFPFFIYPFLLTSGFAILYQPALERLYWNSLPRFKFIPQKLSDEIVIKDNNKTLKKDDTTDAHYHYKYWPYFDKLVEVLNYQNKTLAENLKFHLGLTPILNYEDLSARDFALNALLMFSNIRTKTLKGLGIDRKDPRFSGKHDYQFSFYEENFIRLYFYVLQHLIANDRSDISIVHDWKRRRRLREHGIDLPFTTTHQKGGKMLVRVSMQDFLDLLFSFLYNDNLDQLFSTEHVEHVRNSLSYFNKKADNCVTSKKSFFDKINKNEDFADEKDKFWFSNPKGLEGKTSDKRGNLDLLLKDFLYLLESFIYSTDSKELEKEDFQKLWSNFLTFLDPNKRKDVGALPVFSFGQQKKTASHKKYLPHQEDIMFDRLVYNLGVDLLKYKRNPITAGFDNLSVESLLTKRELKRFFHKKLISSEGPAQSKKTKADLVKLIKPGKDPYVFKVTKKVTENKNDVVSLLQKWEPLLYAKLPPELLLLEEEEFPYTNEMAEQLLSSFLSGGYDLTKSDLEKQTKKVDLVELIKSGKGPYVFGVEDGGRFSGKLPLELYAKLPLKKKPKKGYAEKKKETNINDKFLPPKGYVELFEKLVLKNQLFSSIPSPTNLTKEVDLVDPLKWVEGLDERFVRLFDNILVAETEIKNIGDSLLTKESAFNLIKGIDERVDKLVGKFYILSQPEWKVDLRDLLEWLKTIDERAYLALMSLNEFGSYTSYPLREYEDRMSRIEGIVKEEDEIVLKPSDTLLRKLDVGTNGEGNEIIIRNDRKIKSINLSLGDYLYLLEDYLYLQSRALPKKTIKQTIRDRLNPLVRAFIYLRDTQVYDAIDDLKEFCVDTFTALETALEQAAVSDKKRKFDKNDGKLSKKTLAKIAFDKNRLRGIPKIEKPSETEQPFGNIRILKKVSTTFDRLRVPIRRSIPKELYKIKKKEKGKQFNELLSQKHIRGVRSNLLAFDQNIKPKRFDSQICRETGEREKSNNVLRGSGEYQDVPTFSDNNVLRGNLSYKKYNWAGLYQSLLRKFKKQAQKKRPEVFLQNPGFLFTMVDSGEVETKDNIETGLVTFNDLDTLPKDFLDLYKKTQQRVLMNDYREFYLLAREATKSAHLWESLDYGAWDWNIKDCLYNENFINASFKDFLEKPNSSFSTKGKDPKDAYVSSFVNPLKKDSSFFHLQNQVQDVSIKKKKEKENNCFLSKEPLLIQNALFTAQEGPLVSVPKFKKMVDEKGIKLTKKKDTVYFQLNDDCISNKGFNHALTRCASDSNHGEVEGLYPLFYQLDSDNKRIQKVVFGSINSLNYDSFQLLHTNKKKGEDLDFSKFCLSSKGLDFYKKLEFDQLVDLLLDLLFDLYDPLSKSVKGRAQKWVRKFFHPISVLTREKKTTSNSMGVQIQNVDLLKLVEGVDERVERLFDRILPENKRVKKFSTLFFHHKKNNILSLQKATKDTGLNYSKGWEVDLNQLLENVNNRDIAEKNKEILFDPRPYNPFFSEKLIEKESGILNKDDDETCFSWLKSFPNPFNIEKADNKFNFNLHKCDFDLGKNELANRDLTKVIDGRQITKGRVAGDFKMLNRLDQDLKKVFYPTITIDMEFDRWFHKFGLTLSEWEGNRLEWGDAPFRWGHQDDLGHRWSPPIIASIKKQRLLYKDLTFIQNKMGSERLVENLVDDLPKQPHLVILDPVDLSESISLKPKDRIFELPEWDSEWEEGRQEFKGDFLYSPLFKETISSAENTNHHNTSVSVNKQFGRLNARDFFGWLFSHTPNFDELISTISSLPIPIDFAKLDGTGEKPDSFFFFKEKKKEKAEDSDRFFLDKYFYKLNESSDFEICQAYNTDDTLCFFHEHDINAYHSGWPSFVFSFKDFGSTYTPLTQNLFELEEGRNTKKSKTTNRSFTHNKNNDTYQKNKKRNQHLFNLDEIPLAIDLFTADFIGDKPINSYKREQFSSGKTFWFFQMRPDKYDIKTDQYEKELRLFSPFQERTNNRFHTMVEEFWNLACFTFDTNSESESDKIFGQSDKIFGQSVDEILEDVEDFFFFVYDVLCNLFSRSYKLFFFESSKVVQNCFKLYNENSIMSKMSKSPNKRIKEKVGVWRNEEEKRRKTQEYSSYFSKLSRGEKAGKDSFYNEAKKLQRFSINQFKDIKFEDFEQQITKAEMRERVRSLVNLQYRERENRLEEMKTRFEREAEEHEKDIVKHEEQLRIEIKREKEAQKIDKKEKKNKSNRFNKTRNFQEGRENEDKKQKELERKNKREVIEKKTQDQKIIIKDLKTKRKTCLINKKDVKKKKQLLFQEKQKQIKTITDSRMIAPMEGRSYSGDDFFLDKQFPSFCNHLQRLLLQKEQIRLDSLEKKNNQVFNKQNGRKIFFSSKYKYGRGLHLKDDVFAIDVLPAVGYKNVEFFNNPNEYKELQKKEYLAKSALPSLKHSVSVGYNRLFTNFSGFFRSFSEKISTPLLFLTPETLYPTHDLDSFFQDDLKYKSNDNETILNYQNFNKVRIRYVFILFCSIWFTKTVFVLFYIKHSQPEKIIRLDSLKDLAYRFQIERKKGPRTFTRWMRAFFKERDLDQPAFSIEENLPFTLSDLGGINTLLPQICEIFFTARTSRKDVLFFIKRKVGYFKNEDLFVTNVPKGYVFAGLPGTGKTFLIKALAGEYKIPIVATITGKLMSHLDILDFEMNIKRLTQIFVRAKANAPCILFFDEIDSIGAWREQVETQESHALADAVSNSPLAPLYDFKNITQKKPSTDLLENPAKYWERVPSPFYQNNPTDPTPFEFKQDDPGYQKLEPLQSKIALTKKNKEENEQFLELQGVETENSIKKVKIGMQENEAVSDIQLHTLIQLLIELDKVSKHQGVVLIGATNRYRFLDYTLRRQGRFSGIVKVVLPGKSRRIEILKLWTKKSGLVPKKPEERKVPAFEKLSNNLFQTFLNKKAKTYLFEGFKIVSSSIKSTFFKKNSDYNFDKIIRSYRDLIKDGFFTLENFLNNLDTTPLMKSEYDELSDPDFSWDYLGRITVNFSPADLSVAINISAMRAISQSSLHTIETMERGIASVTNYSFPESYLKERDLVPWSYYQAGKAVIHTLLPQHLDVLPLTLSSQPKSTRHKTGIPKINRFESRATLESRIIGLYAGKAAGLVFLSPTYKTTRLSPTIFTNSHSVGFEEDSATLGLGCKGRIGRQKALEVSDLYEASYIAYALINKFFFYSEITSLWKGSEIPAYVALYRYATIPQRYADPSSKVYSTLKNRVRLDRRRVRGLHRELDQDSTSFNNVQSMAHTSLLIDQIWQKLRQGQLYFNTANYTYLLLNVKWSRFLSKEVNYGPNIRDTVAPDFHYSETDSLKNLSWLTFPTTTTTTTKKSQFKESQTNCFLSQKLTTSQSEQKNQNKFKQGKNIYKYPFTWNHLCEYNRDYIYHGLTFTFFNQAFNYLDDNRELLDYLAEYLMRFKIIRPRITKEFVSRFTYNSKEKENKRRSEDERLDPNDKETDQEKGEGKINMIWRKKWGKNSILTFSDFLTFSPEEREKQEREYQERQKEDERARAAKNRKRLRKRKRGYVGKPYPKKYYGNVGKRRKGGEFKRKRRRRTFRR